ncbi:conserved hypothetical protein [Methylovorus sp. MP688]|nr:conserved hypothetical protein [Methylovorus sp. MP688]
MAFFASEKIDGDCMYIFLLRSVFSADGEWLFSAIFQEG